MKYINAEVLLPDWLVRELQTYIQGGYIYVPSDPAQPKRWGEVSGYRQELQMRNRQIVAASVFVYIVARSAPAPLGACITGCPLGYTLLRKVHLLRWGRADGRNEFSNTLQGIQIGSVPSGG